ncbi:MULTISPECIES: ThiF family adenylyltransferase [Stenotrophomonas]|uniref:HesA/MoeB/ThiF family protein n=1 Tax=Stenotrophomonas TaxID=40323 RepID=UPI0008725BB7|nr:ThiF family adenylyltransferase [Stenotrophomonas sp. BIIR7]OEZ00580.1 hypothetical protein BIY45_10815 [Stenotrophomonas sp. BIIR7]
MTYAKPLLKRSHHVLISDAGDVCIGEIPGKSKILLQPPSWVVPALEALDGAHTLPRIGKELAARGHAVSSDELTAFVGALAGFSLVEEGARASSVLTAEELERYDRQILQFALVDEQRVDNAVVYQERLKKARVLILGMGGWGTWCALNLARAGIGTLRLVDGDEVELSNLNRQVLYSAADIGAKKVHAAARALQEHNGSLVVECACEFATEDTDRLDELLADVDVVIVAWASLGYYRTRTVERVVHSLAANHGIPVIELGGDPLDISVGPVYLNDGSHLGFEDIRKSAQQAFYSSDPTVRAFQEARMRNDFRNGNRVVNAWQSAPSLAVMSGLVADQVVKLISGYDRCNLVGRRFHLSMQTYAIREEVVFARS